MLLTSPRPPCRLSIHTSGQVVHSHKRSTSWNINTYIQSLQQQDGLSPRDIYWRVWSLVNTLQCSQCQAIFQCGQLMGCPYHPQGAVSSTLNGLIYPCCSQTAMQFSMLPSTQVGVLHSVYV